MKEAKNYEGALEKCSKINLDPVTMWINGNDIYINNIKEKFLLYFLMNEVLCPEVMDLKDIDGCLLSIKREYELVPDNLKEEYLKERKKFFDDTITIYTEVLIKNDIDECSLILKKQYEVDSDNLKEEYLEERKKISTLINNIKMSFEYVEQLKKCVKFLESEIKKS